MCGAQLGDFYPTLSLSEGVAGKTAIIVCVVFSYSFTEINEHAGRGLLIGER